MVHSQQLSLRKKRKAKEREEEKYKENKINGRMR